MLWIILGVMCFAAVVFAIWPFLRENSRNFTVVIASVVFVVGASAVLYSLIGSPDIRPGASADSDGEMSAVVGSLAKRLENDPNDIEGWRMLGRSYMALGNYPLAVQSFEKVVELESGHNAQSLVDLGEAMLAESGQNMTPRIVALFENALTLEPGNPAALFWGGIGAINRGDRSLAADRWERLLGTNPPAEIRDTLRQRIAEWRGEEAAVPPQAAAAPRSSRSTASEPAVAPEPAEPASDAIVSASIALSDAAASSLPADGIVFVIARDPEQPSPPIAVTRELLSQLPAVIQLDDAASMVAGRALSGFEEFELEARVSLSGQPGKQPGDWFGTVLVRPAENNSVSLSIDTQVQ
ncbi:MAG: tetratricopeptide repeat protein [Woeseiaceae bacterium]